MFEGILKHDMETQTIKEKTVERFDYIKNKNKIRKANDKLDNGSETDPQNSYSGYQGDKVMRKLAKEETIK